MPGCLRLPRILYDEYVHLYGEPPKPADPGTKPVDPDDLDQVIALLHSQPRAALCISGGGIRSASFALGVIQGLAKLGRTAKDSFLARIDYLSTVSGGGYIGSWLSGWSHREKGIENVIDKLRRSQPPNKLDPEPGPVHHLREYSNYLTPHLGIFSADTWAFFGAYLRNLLLMWLVLIPLFVGILAVPRVFVSLTMGEKQHIGLGIEYAAFLLFAWAIAFTGLTRPTAKATPNRWVYRNGAFQLLCLLPLCLFAAAVAIGHAWFNLSRYGPVRMMAAGAIFTFLSSLIYTIRKVKDEGVSVMGKQWKELFVAAISGAFLGVLLFLFLTHFEFPLTPMAQAKAMAWIAGQVPALGSSIAARYVVFAVPLVLLALLLQATVFIGATGRFNDDFDREWWGRAAAWVIIAGLAWIIVTAVVIYGPVGIYYAPRTIGAIGGITGLFAAGAGRSGKTSANEKQKEKESTTGAVTNVLLGLATPVFALVLLAALSLGTTKLLEVCLVKRGIIVERKETSKDLDFLKRTSWTYEQKRKDVSFSPVGKGDQTLKTIEHPAIEKDKLAGLDHLYVLEKTPTWTSLALFAGAILFAIFASWLIGVNRFSIHALYRDRITRAYLGASTDIAEPEKKREANPFTGFDKNDNLAMAELQMPKRPFHVVNMCLNLTSGENLAWQERKAESFTASPLHCGNLNLGYRLSNEYGGGMKLGTAVGISGAAASPNQGYHSSPALALLMTFFNVRLGWWLGNPANDATYNLDNPNSSLKPLLAEAFGMSDDHHPYVYLSDGGHFENLGFYEMVLRRCRNIVISDAGQDDKFIFDDLGNAIRKIYIDFGIPVVIEDVRLFPRSPDREKKWENPKYCAFGRILYSRVDGPAAPVGRFVYIKPVFYGLNEPKDIFNYAVTNEQFPHEPTLPDQFFSESQLESYRGLGEYAVQQFVGSAGGANVNSVEDLMKAAEAYAKG